MHVLVASHLPLLIAYSSLHDSIFFSKQSHSFHMVLSKRSFQNRCASLYLPLEDRRLDLVPRPNASISLSALEIDLGPLFRLHPLRCCRFLQSRMRRVAISFRFCCHRWTLHRILDAIESVFQAFNGTFEQKYRFLGIL